MLPNTLQAWLQGGKHAVLCAYPQYFSRLKCAMSFDYSDHIVLGLVQYFLPALLETGYVLSCRLPNFFAANHFNRSRSVSASQGDGKTVEVERGSGMWGLYGLSLVVAAVQIVLVWRSVVFTCLFFHTAAENFVALAIGSILVFLPLCASSYTRQLFVYVVYSNISNGNGNGNGDKDCADN